MILNNWEKVVTAWANSLNLVDVKVDCVDELVYGEFIPELLKIMGYEFCSSEPRNCLEMMKNFLKDEYELLELNDTWSTDDILLGVSLVLLSGSLRSHDLRTPLFQLNSSIQLAIQSFLQAFINVPRNLVDRRLVLDTLDKLENESADDDRPLVVANLEEEVNEAEGEGLAVSPRPMVDSTPIDSPVNSCRTKVLKSQMQVLNWDNQHLVDEVETLKEDLEKLRKRYDGKVQEVLKLENELFLIRDLKHTDAESQSQRSDEQIASLKTQISDSETVIRSLRLRLDAEQSTVERLKSDLGNAQRSRNDLEIKLEDSESRNLALQNTVDGLTCVTENLKKTCLEQSHLLADYNNAACGVGQSRVNDSFSNDSSFIGGAGEALDQVIDLKCAELENELGQTREALAESQTRVEELTAELKEVNRIVDELRFDVRSRDSEITKLQEERYGYTGKGSDEQGQKEREIIIKIKDVLLSSLLKMGSTGKNEIVEETSDGIHLLLNKVETEVDRCRRLVSINETLRTDLTTKHRELEIALKSLTRSRQEVQKLEIEISDLRGDLRVRGTNMVALEQQVNMCEHEKAILLRKIDLLKVDADRLVSVKVELSHWQERAVQAENDLAAERLATRRLRNEIEIEEKLNNNFDSKLVQLQQKMKIQYEQELNRTIEEYTEKINQLKRKMLKDKAKIEELSTDLWDTSDKYLLASQETKALRAQLRRAELTIKQLAITGGGASDDEGRDSDRNHLCMWQPPEGRHNIEDRMIVLKERWSFGGERPENGEQRASLWSVPSVPIFARLPDTGSGGIEDANGERFGPAFLEDLKAGIVRLPPTGLGGTRRRTFEPTVGQPNNTGTPDNSGDKSSGCESQPLLPPDKPKRKSQIAYSRPGPPTPSRNGRLSLQNNSSLPKTAESHPPQPPTITHHHKRLSKIFGTKAIPIASEGTEVKPLPQPTPKSKRKSFFLRKFGSNRENIPPH